jgi:hypothetical protein
MVDPGRLRPADVIDFIEYGLAGALRDKTVATHVRIFLQYLFGNGATAANLALSVPKAAKRWGARLPRHLSPEGVESLSRSRQITEAGNDPQILLTSPHVNSGAVQTRG